MVEEKAGIKHGISGAQWEQYLSEDKEKFQYSLIGSSAGVGMDIVKSISITYNKDDFVRISPNLNLKDFDETMKKNKKKKVQVDVNNTKISIGQPNLVKVKLNDKE